MKSRWYESKDKAITLRKRGLSIGKIERRLGIPRSTLSGWFKNIELTSRQKEKLHQNWEDALIHARKKAALWHNLQKEQRLRQAENEAKATLEKIDSTKTHILELALAILYFGEGSKKNVETALGSSDPLMLKFFLSVLRNVYGIETKSIRCELSLRADQKPEKLKKYWAKELKVPLSCFKQVNIDKRTAGTKTYSHYKGVCNIRCGNVAIQRRLVNISRIFCEEVSQQTT